MPIVSWTRYKHTVYETKEEVLPPTRTSEIHLWDDPTNKLYTDNCGQFTIRSCSGKKILMIAYHCDTNTILQATLDLRNYKHRILVYNSIMKCLANRGHKDDMQVIDKEISAKYKMVITEDWQEKFQLVTPNVHQRNVAERAPHTLKTYF